jgi:hypothetical protein
MRLLFLLIFGLVGLGGRAQDTLRYRHHFRLPVADNQLGYEKNISQHPANIHYFIFRAPDSCTVYITIRSENNSLDIFLGEQRIKIKTREKNGQYLYGWAGTLPVGENIFTVRTRKYCGYKVYVKGQSTK